MNTYLLDLKVLIAVVEEYDADLSAVVLVNDSGPHVDLVLEGEAGTRSDAGVGVGWTGPFEASADHGVLAGRHDLLLACADVIAGSIVRPFPWVFGILVDSLHKELAGHFPPKININDIITSAYSVITTRVINIIVPQEICLLILTFNSAILFLMFYTSSSSSGKI
jgi:hypothetical protein